MVIVMEITSATLLHPPSLAALKAAAAEDALVLTCHHRAVRDGLAERLREALPRQRIVAFPLASMSPEELDLIERALGMGMVALVTSRSHRMVVRVTGWLKAEITLILPGEQNAA